MKKAFLFSAIGTLAAFSGAVQAEEVGRVLSATPVVQQVQVPRQVCNVQPMPAQTSGGGAVVGAIVGGLLGNNIGHGGGRAAATALGLVGGAAVGNNIEQNGAYAQSAQQCSTQVTYENRTVAYNVTYEYAGKQYMVQMPYDPGPTIRLQLSPIGSNATAPSTFTAESGATYAPQAVMVSPVAVPTATLGYPVYSAYPAYYRPYYYNPYPVSLSIGLGYYGGYGHHRWH